MKQNDWVLFKLEGVFLLFVIGALVSWGKWICHALPEFPFLVYNLVGLGTLLYFIRLIFFLKWSILEYTLWGKALLMVLSIPLFMFLQQGLQQYLLFLEEYRLEEYLDGMISKSSLRNSARFFHRQYLFAIVGSMISMPFVLIALIRSVRRNLKKSRWTKDQRLNDRL